MLWRALGSIQSGFWIDVGAGHPTEFSVTRAFYDRGWHGVNIEPEPNYATMLRSERPLDINLQVAVAATPGHTTLHRIAGTGLSTMDVKIASHHAASGYAIAQPIDVEVTTLAAVCGQYVTGDIHFLKIDAEGAEREVLLGADFGTYRPWVIVAEATVPGSSEVRIGSFADLLAGADYRQCWFDGLNAFFVAAEHHSDLSRYFQTPPNVFDHFVLAEQVAAVARATSAEHRVAEAANRLGEAQSRIAELEDAWHAGQARIHDLTASYEAQAAELIRVGNEIRNVGSQAQESKAEVRRLLTECQRQQSEIRELVAHAERQTTEIRELVAHAERQATEITQLIADLDALRRSSSWRLTEPLRATARLLGRR